MTLSGFYTPAKRLRADRPVGELVRDVFRSALAARGMLAGDPASAAYLLSGAVRRLDCRYFFDQEAHAHLDVELASRDGAIVYRATREVDAEEGGWGPGAMADMNEVRRFIQLTLNRAVDRTLDDPELRERIGAQPAPVKVSQARGSPDS